MKRMKSYERSNHSRCLTLLCLSILVFAWTGCGSGSSDDGGFDGDQGANTGELVSQCGVIYHNSARQSVDSGGAEFVTVLPSRPDLVVVRRELGPQAGGEQLVKLHGVTSAGVSSYLFNKGISTISEQTSGGAYLVLAGCDASIDGQQGVYGQLFSTSGQNINELLLANGSVVPAAEACGGDQLTGCYSTIEAQEEFSPEMINDFLWKPVSDSDGKLVVLVNPYNATIVVNGSETLRNVGAGNGRGSQGRARRAGCAYGNNAKVEVFDSQGRRMLTLAGEPFITVPRGCQRYTRRW